MASAISAADPTATPPKDFAISLAFPPAAEAIAVWTKRCYSWWSIV